jgi:hypothetical protein
MPVGLPPLSAPSPVAPATPVGPAIPPLAPSAPGPVRLGAPRAPDPAPGALPPTVGLGVNTIHRYDEPRVAPSHIAITVFTPVLAPGQQGTILDTNAKPFDRRMPDVFVLGDAGHSRAFVGVDRRPGTALDRHLERLLERVPRRDGAIHPEDAIEFVRREVSSIIAWTAGSSFNDGRKEFPWDRPIQVPDAVWGAFSAAGAQSPGDGPLETGASHPVVPLERYLELGQGYCIQKALLAALLLEHAGVPVRLVNGAVARSPGVTIGHTWLELADGRILDPAWRTVSPRGPAHELHADWFAFGGSHRFANRHFPYLALEA